MEETTNHRKRLERKLRDNNSVVATRDKGHGMVQGTEHSHDQHHEHGDKHVHLHRLSGDVLLQYLVVSERPAKRTRSSSFSFWIAFFCFFSSLALTIWSFFLETTHDPVERAPTFLRHSLKLSRHGLIVRCVVDEYASHNYASRRNPKEATFSGKIDHEGQEDHTDGFLKEVSHVEKKNESICLCFPPDCLGRVRGSWREGWWYRKDMYTMPW